MLSSINLWAVLVSAVAAFVIGFLAHGPIAGKLWMKLANIVPTGNEKFSDMVPQMLGNLFTNFVTAFGLAIVYLFASAYLNNSGAHFGILCGLFVWIVFLVPSTAIEVIWMGRKTKLWLFEVVCSGITMAVMGAIIATW